MGQGPPGACAVTRGSRVFLSLLPETACRQTRGGSRLCLGHCSECFALVHLANTVRLASYPGSPAGSPSVRQREPVTPVPPAGSRRGPRVTAQHCADARPASPARMALMPHCGTQAPVGGARHCPAYVPARPGRGEAGRMRAALRSHSATRRQRRGWGGHSGSGVLSWSVSVPACVYRRACACIRGRSRKRLRKTQSRWGGGEQGSLRIRVPSSVSSCPP